MRSELPLLGRFVMPEKLRPCPFCGGEMFVKWIMSEGWEDGLNCWNGGCCGCGYTLVAAPGLGRWPEGKEETRKQFVALLNNRPDIRRETIEGCAKIVDETISALSDGPYGKDIEDVIAGVLMSVREQICALAEEAPDA